MLKYTNIKPWSIFVALLLLVSFSNAQSQDNVVYDTTILTGAEQGHLYLDQWKGKRVAVVANQTSWVYQSGMHLVDYLLQEGVHVKKVFAPEHGFRGKADAGEKINSGLDAQTGLPLISLYGRRKKPSKEDLFDVDIVVFDIQDVGARFYTYISTMHYMMEACAENNKPLYILDRPNPNGFYVDGPVLQMENNSFVGMHPVPIVHGMTIGEYAQMINGEKWLKEGVQCPLKIIECANYEHADFYELKIKPSPNLPNMSSIFLYPSLCLFEGTSVSVGRGTDLQFQVIGSPTFASGDYEFTPEPSEGAKRPKHKGVKCKGYHLSAFGVTEIPQLKALYLHWLVTAYQESTNKKEFFRKDGFFRLLTGKREIRKMIENGKTAAEIQESWKEEVEAFKQIRAKYLLYPDVE